WSEIDPSIMGTLFERGLDPDKRSQLGAHYTDRDKIMRIVEPVIQRPLEAEWADAKARIEAALGKAEAARSPAVRTKLRNEAQALYRGFLDRLGGFKVLDPACGSGNFLYLALHALKDLELRAGIEAEALGLPREFPRVGPEQLLGIEINPYAAELARVSVWIGEIQWMLRHGFAVARNPILRTLETIACRDALLQQDGGAATWPEADAIIGNPPFLGGKFLRDGLGDDQVNALFAVHDGVVPREADLVCYWFAKANAAIRSGRSARAGLVTTNSIRGGANRKVLDRIRDEQVIFDAWSDEPWVIDGANVRVSLVCFARPDDQGARSPRLDGAPVERIFPDLTGVAADRGVDLTTARRLPENMRRAFMGDTKGGAFDIPGELAREWLQAPANPNGRPDSDVLRPWINGPDVTRRPRDMWIIDFGGVADEASAAFYERPFQHAIAHVREERVARQSRGYARTWWQHERPRPEMWSALSGLRRYLAPRWRSIASSFGSMPASALITN
ncbi:MAG TPA: DNA methyltransferase, partial [Geminicoccaceae bacterium]|nr:DNA methyltransferase [Geminicoccaceae bacterium]